MFRDCKQEAFSQNRFFTSLLFFTSFAYSGYLSVRHKLYLLMCVTTVALITFSFFELIVRKEKRSNEENKKQKAIIT